jgi:hypothetical protein
MKLLLDECVVRDLKRDLIGHDVSTAVEAGFGGLENGDLLRAAAGNYDVLITVDQNLQYQQNIGTLQIAVLVLISTGITHRDLQPLIPTVLEKLTRIQSGEIEIVSR